MKRLSWAAAFLAVASFAQAGGVDWMTDYEKGLEKAKDSGKLVQLHFTADW